MGIMSQASADPNVDYATWLARRKAEMSPARSWAHALFAAAAGGPWAIGSAMMAHAAGLAGLIVYGPIIEEVLKIAIVAGTIERHPYLYRSPRHVRVAAMGGAFMFAAIENLMYLLHYLENPTVEMWIWRWTACVGLHVVCTAIAAEGVVRVWRRAMDRHERPQLAPAGPWLLAAVVLHSAYNTIMTFVDIGQPVG